MKLYATTTSERASKWQGGNKFIKSDITLNEVSVVQTIVEKLTDTEYRLHISSDGKTLVERVLKIEEKQKGKSQKGVVYCKQCLKSSLGGYELRKQCAGCR